MVRGYLAEDIREKLISLLKDSDDGMSGIEISKSCPYNYQQILADCIDRGWVKPVAYIKTKELFWEVLEQ